jgi:hypothetical protein
LRKNSGSDTITTGNQMTAGPVHCLFARRDRGIRHFAVRLFAVRLFAIRFFAIRNSPVRLFLIRLFASSPPVRQFACSLVASSLFASTPGCSRKQRAKKHPLKH